MARPGFTTDRTEIVGVLLGDGKWYAVAPGSFELGAWEVAGDEQTGGVEAARLGFRFEAADGPHAAIAGPITALVAVGLDATTSGARTPGPTAPGRAE